MNLAPPIGLKPRKFWLEERAVEVRAAIARYRAAHRKIPHQWIWERRWLEVELGRKV